GTEKVLHSFHGTPDGAFPVANVIRDKTGNLYGTTMGGGSGSQGTVFKLAPDGTETLLHEFTGGTEGAEPWGGLIADREANLYGTTRFGGDNYSGTVFRITPDGGKTVLHSFSDNDGTHPFAGLTKGKKGSFYGTTNDG